MTTTATTPSLRPSQQQSEHRCRFCSAPVQHSVCDLGMHPLCENFLTAEQTQQAEPFYPLQAFVCEQCYLIQVKEYVHGTEIFGGEYAYFSSFSDSWLQHCAHYVDAVIPRLGLNADSHVVELASNDGYLLQNFVRRGIPCTGIEPAENVAAAAEQKGVPTRVMYFDSAVAAQLRDEGLRPQLMIANNVLAHVPDLNDFVAGIHILLADDGVLTVEFPHALHTLEQNQFDQIYQEHYCYFSLLTLEKVFAAHGMTIFDLDELPTHGGSLRIYVKQADNESLRVCSAVTDMRALESVRGLDDVATYLAFAEQVKETKRAFLEYLITAKREGRQVVGYGAPGKGNTMLNYCGVKTDFIDYVVDRNPYKHGRFLPGSHIPVCPPEKLAETRPDDIVILPWNLRDEIAQQLDYTREWGARLVVAVPELTVF